MIDTRQPRWPSAQRGVSLGGVMIVVVLIVFFATIAIRTVPAYVTFWQVRSIMDGLQDKPQVLAEGRSGILSALDSQLNIEGIRSLTRRDFDLVRSNGSLELSLDYEVRTHLFFNVDVIMHFVHTTVLDET